MSSWMPAPAALRRLSITASISASLILIMLTTSRSRTRSTISWSRMLSRNLLYWMPSWRSRSRSWGRVIWFWVATLVTARSSSASSIRVPVSRAAVTSTRSSMSVSRTCFLSTAGGGSAVRLRVASSRTRARRCCSSLAVTSSVLTTATM